MVDLPRTSKDNSIATNFGIKESRAYLVTKIWQNLNHIPYILDDQQLFKIWKSAIVFHLMAS